MKKIIVILAVFIINLFNPSFAIKIGLQTAVNTIGIGASTEAVIIDANTNKSVCSLEAMKGYEVRSFKNKIAIKFDGKYYKIDSDNIVLRTQEEGFVSVKNKWYRGILMIQNKNGKLTVVNNVGIEDYIKGVLPSEMPSGWESEALKAQAIAARSYALANLGKRAKYGYDLNDTPEDQAYGGASSETIKTNQIVEDSKGLVLIYDLKIIPAYYSASAGGQTINASTAWGSDLPFIRSVPSYDDNVKKNGHGVGMSQHGANNLAKQGYNAYQILQYFYKNVKFARINPEYYN
ncbi:SpoIID/LytB domain-containing protein [bacterium]|nr:SpoIID/LytB domain-containing protein [bacterium]